MTLDEAVAIFERELPGWCWKVCQCGISADAWAVPDYSVAGPHDDLETDEALAFDHRFDSGFDVELRHTLERTFTPWPSWLRCKRPRRRAMLIGLRQNR